MKSKDTKTSFFDATGINSKNISLDQLVLGYEKLLWDSYNADKVEDFVNSFSSSVSAFNDVLNDFFGKTVVAARELSFYIVDAYQRLHDISKESYQSKELVFLLSCVIQQKMYKMAIDTFYEDAIYMAFCNAYCITQVYDLEEQIKLTKKYS